MATEQPKKPVAGAFGQFLNEKREEIKAMLPGQSVAGIGKKAGELWRELPEAEKAKYDERFKSAQQAYTNALEAFRASGGVVATKKKTVVKSEKDPGAPKKPAGGGYGRFLAEKREEIKAALPEGHKITDVAKKAGEMWKALPDEKRACYDGLFREAMEKYRHAMEEYESKGGAEEAAEPEEAAASPAKRCSSKSSAGETPPSKRGRKCRSSATAGGVPLDEETLQAAQKRGLEQQLRNLAAREEVVASGKTAVELLSVLEKAGGLVNPAKHALLGA